jgi:multidrug efflux system membrane fusion protein
MIDRRRPIRGVLESIGWGVLDDARINLPRALPYVERSMNWVRVAQRFPVRIRLIDPPEDLMRVGASAVVQVGYGQSCP